MSINFTSDIDGATSGSGITKITIGGKTINLTEVSSGSSGGVVSGTFTPEEKATTLSIDTGIDFSFIMVVKKTTTLNYGYRTRCAFAWDRTNQLLMSVGTNAGGGSFTGGLGIPKNDTVAGVNGSTNTEEKDGTSLVINSNDTVGWLAPEEYQWYAW